MLQTLSLVDCFGSLIFLRVFLISECQWLKFENGSYSSSTAEIGILAGMGFSTAEIGILAGMGFSTAEIGRKSKFHHKTEYNDCAIIIFIFHKEIPSLAIPKLLRHFQLSYNKSDSKIYS